MLLAVVVAAGPVGDGKSYEDTLIDHVIQEQGLERVLVPDGLEVESVLVSTDDVIGAIDPWPSIINWIHVRTRESVVRREALLETGRPWVADRALETERILRSLFIFAVAKVVAVKGERGGVRALVVTKDRWSLRLNSEFTFSGGQLTYLRLRPTEQNFLGRNMQVSADFILRRDTIQVGEAFTDRRGFGSDVFIQQAGLLIFNRATGAFEGANGSAFVGKPLLTLAQPWAYGVSGSANVRRRRIFRGASVWQLPYPDETAPSASVPYVYDVLEGGAAASVTRSFGLERKLDLVGTVGGYLRQYTPPKESPLSDEQRAWFTSKYLPRSENALYTSLTFRAFTADFRALRDLDTFQLSEDYQLGPLLKGGVRWAVPTPWTSHFVELGIGLRYRWLLGGDLLTLNGATAARVVPGQGLYNRAYAFEIQNLSPKLEGGRFFTRFAIEGRANDLNNTLYFLGGDTGLRGTLPESYSGRNKLLLNVEYRTRPFEVATIVMGFVLFYDMGSAFDAMPNLVHTMGGGLRILLPQVNQEVIRIDFGMVLGGPDRPGLDRFTATFGQVNDVHPGLLDDPI